MNQSQDPAVILSQAHATIEHQAGEIKALKQQLEREQFAQELRQLLINSAVINMILSPFAHTHLLEMVVQTAAEVISAEAGSLFLLDTEANDLVFQAAVGPAAQAVKQFHVPLGHGIAGMVALTGQPMILANTGQDKRLAFDIASSVNYIPENMLCIPLFYDGHVIGALELLNKKEGSFTPKDMDTLGLFAKIAAFAIAQSQAYNLQGTILHRLLDAFQEITQERRQELYRQALDFFTWVEQEDSIYTRACKLAKNMHEMLLLGEQECEMCIGVLQSFIMSQRNRRDISRLKASH